MPPKKELCRNFQRGSCQYGDRCRYLHSSQQQAKPNFYGFGSQSGTQSQRPNTQTQKPNPFGFGQINSQPKVNDIGSKSNQFKPFENTWSRNAANSSAARQPDNQSSAPPHKCTDSESCKRQIVEDLQHERPLWKLTCYGHIKNGPCEIVGDVSYEELRSAAYEDAKQGLSMQAIVEKERNLLKSKLLEFESLLHNPYSAPRSSTLGSQNAFPGATPVASPLLAQNTAPPSVSSFSQLGTSFNAGLGIRPTTPNNSFGQLNPFQASSQIPSVPGGNNFSFGNAGSLVSQPPNQSFGNSVGPGASIFGNAGSGSFGTQPPNQSFGSSVGPGTSIFGNNGSLGSQPPKQSFGSSVGPSTSVFGNGGISAGQNPFSTTSPSLNSSSNQAPVLLNGPNIAANGVPESANLRPMDNSTNVNRANIDGIWLKEKWNPGEIPEEAPPDEAIW